MWFSHIYRLNGPLGQKKTWLWFFISHGAESQRPAAFHLQLSRNISGQSVLCLNIGVCFRVTGGESLLSLLTLISRSEQKLLEFSVSFCSENTSNSEVLFMIFNVQSAVPDVYVQDWKFSLKPFIQKVSNQNGSSLFFLQITSISLKSEVKNNRRERRKSVLTFVRFLLEARTDFSNNQPASTSNASQFGASCNAKTKQLHRI